MAILEVGSHIGGITDEVVSRMRPATNLLADAVRASSSYVDRLLRFDTIGTGRTDSTMLLQARVPRDSVGRRATDVIVPRSVTRC